MAQETEAKFYVRRLPEVQQKAESLGAGLLEKRVHEINLRFDTAARELHRAGRVLRLRQDRRARLTYKDTESMEVSHLSRREIEVTVSDFDTTRELLEALGYEVVLIYEKYRTTYKLNGLELVLDELPYGHFIEIEGDASPLQKTAEELGLNWPAVIPDSYTRLFERLKLTRELEFRDLTFNNLKGLQISPEDLGVQPADD